MHTTNDGYRKSIAKNYFNYKKDYYGTYQYRTIYPSDYVSAFGNTHWFVDACGGRIIVNHKEKKVEERHRKLIKKLYSDKDTAIKEYIFDALKFEVKKNDKTYYKWINPTMIDYDAVMAPSSIETPTDIGIAVKPKEMKIIEKLVLFTKNTTKEIDDNKLVKIFKNVINRRESLNVFAAESALCAMPIIYPPGFILFAHLAITFGPTMSTPMEVLCFTVLILTFVAPICAAIMCYFIGSAINNKKMEDECKALLPETKLCSSNAQAIEPKQKIKA